jgi:hypothetical protein
LLELKPMTNPKVAHARAEEVPTHRLLWDGVAFVGMRPIRASPDAFTTTTTWPHSCEGLSGMASRSLMLVC